MCTAEGPHLTQSLCCSGVEAGVVVQDRAPSPASSRATRNCSPLDTEATRFRPPASPLQLLLLLLLNLCVRSRTDEAPVGMAGVYSWFRSLSRAHTELTLPLVHLR